MAQDWKVELHGTGDAPFWVVNVGGPRFTMYDHKPACLIAAAPALYAACRAFLKDHDDTYDGEPMSMERLDAIDAMRTAVSKAGGCA